MLTLPTLALATAVLATSQGWLQSDSLAATGALAIDGDVAVVGGPSGARVFEFDGSNWALEAVLQHPCYGSTLVAVSGTRVAVAGVNACSPLTAGAAVVYHKIGGSWVLDDVVHQPAGGSLGSLFGHSSLALQGDQLVVGAEGDGQVHVFSRKNGVWRDRATLMNPGSLFGTFVDLDGSTLAITGNTPPFGAGAVQQVFVYTGARETWALQDVISGGRSGQIALWGDLLVRGASASQGELGEARIYRRSGARWSQEALLTADDGFEGDGFGHSVAVFGSMALIGTHRNNNVVGELGAAYRFDYDGSGWNEGDRLAQTTPGSSFTTLFTPLVALNGHRALTSDWNSTTTMVHEGDSAVPYCLPGTSFNGCQPALESTGTASASAATGFQLVASGAEGAAGGFFFFGFNGRQANPWGNGTSFQCVIPPTLRAGLMTASGTHGQCDGTFAQDLNALWCAGCPQPVKNPGPSALVQAQLWYRDPQNTSNQTTSLSNAVEFGLAP